MPGKDMVKHHGGAIGLQYKNVAAAHPPFNFSFPCYLSFIRPLLILSNTHQLSALMKSCNLTLETWFDSFVPHLPFRLILQGCSATSHSYSSFHSLQKL